jgi:uncharacterized protein YjbJ (UPF0337 family)
MGQLSKLRNRFMISRGRARQKVGRLTRNRSMQRRGTAERLSGAARQACEHVKDAGRSVRSLARR